VRVCDVLSPNASIQRKSAERHEIAVLIGPQRITAFAIRKGMSSDVNKATIPKAKANPTMSENATAVM